MTIRVEIAGKGTAEFPDGTSDAVIHLAVQRDYFGRDPSISEKAAARLAQQGLTLDQVKANPIEPQEHQSMLSEIANDQNATTGTGDAIIGVLKAVPKMIQSVGDFGANPIASAVNAGADMGRRYAQTEQDFPNDPIRRGISKTLAATPIVGSVAQDLLQPSFVATHREPTPEERQAASGAAVNVGAMMAGPALKDLTGRGTGIVEGSQGQYARAVSTPLTESLASQVAPDMMNRIGVVRGDPAKLAANAGAASSDAALNASATQAALEATAKPRGTVGPDGLTLDAENTALANKRTSLAQQQEMFASDATAQANIQQVLSALADTNPRTVGNILTQAGTNVMKRGVGGEIGSAVLDHVLPQGTVAGVVSVIEATKALKALVKTPAFQTATAMAKRSFGQALQTGDIMTASELGAGIASGALAEDAFGHRKAVQALSQEVAQYPSVDLKRQAVAAKKWVYVDPKSGVDIALPPNVGTAFANSPYLTETASPVQAYVSAMIKQGKLTKGGRVEFR